MNKTLIFIVMLFLLSSTVLAVDSTRANPDGKSLPEKMLRSLGTQDVSDHCYAADESYAVYHNGLWWAWLAPVATTNWNGAGVTPDASLMGDGWRNVKDSDEWALRPSASAFGNTKCAATLFFSPAPWCDWGDPDYVSSEYPNGAVTYYIDGTVSEFWVVHDDCNSNEVPEFGVVAGAIALIAGIGIIAYRRK